MLSLETLAAIATQHSQALPAPVKAFHLRGQTFDGNTGPDLMGVINLSADSWYRESVCLSVDTAIERGCVLAAQGAAILDIGAESSLAHAARIGDSEQQTKLLPVVRELSARGHLVSVETYHPSVTRACFEAGARVLNLTGTVDSEEMFRLVADHEGAVILCYVQGANVREVSDYEFSQDPITPLYDYFARQIEKANRCGVNKLWIDPGLGFYYRNLQDSAARIRHQIQIFLHTFRLRTLGWPTCHALPHAFECFGEEVRCGEPFFAVLAALGKTDLFRTHEVPRTRAVLKAMALA